MIAGDLGGHAGPARTLARSTWDMKLNAGHTTTLTVKEGHTLALVMLHGAILVNGEEVVRETQMVRFDRAGDAITISQQRRRAAGAAGEPIDELSSATAVRHEQRRGNPAGVPRLQQRQFGSMNAEASAG